MSTIRDTAHELLERSNRLGADPRNTNYAGGNTSAKGIDVDPVTGEPVELLWVKGSGGDLGTLTEAGLAVLRLDRLRALVDVYPGVEREDEMVAAFDYCLHGKGGAAPSIDTAMHGLVDAAHVDHLHPDSGIAFATAADGEALTQRVLRRPGRLGAVAAARASSSASTSPRSRRDHPPAIGAILGGHGITAWGETSRGVRGELARDHPDRRAVHRASTAEPEPFGAVVDGLRAAAGRRAPRAGGRARCRSSAGSPRRTGRRSATSPTPRSSSTSWPARSIRGSPRSAPRAPTTSCGPRSGRWCSTCRRRRRSRRRSRGSASCTPPYREDYAAYYERHADARQPADARRRPGDRARPGVGMFSFGADKQTARVAGEFYVNAINVMRGAEGVSTYAPIPESEKFRIEYWALEEAKLQRMPAPKPLATPGRAGDRRRLGHRQGDRPAARGRGRLRRRRRHRRRERARPSAARSADRTSRSACPSTSPTRTRSPQAFRDAVLAFGGVDLVVNNAGLSISKSLLETTVDDWDLQHDVMATRLVPRLARGRPGHDRAGHGRRHRLHRQQERVLRRPEQRRLRRVQGRPGPPGAAAGGRARRVRHPGQRRQPRRRRPRLRDLRQGLGRRPRADYGVPEDKLGEFYAQRTLLKREVLPEHVAAAVFALVGGDLSQTTGLHIPVDAGVAAAFLR